MSWHSMVRGIIRHATGDWRAACKRFERLVTRADAGPLAVQEVEDAAAEMAKHVETLVTAIRDLERAERLDREKRLERSRQ